MSEKTPNHICKNIHCTKGADGKQKHYYACDYCDHSFNWRSVACSFECYQAYMEQVIEARSQNKEVNNLPLRTDKSEEEVQKLMDAPTDEVIESTKEDLKEYIGDNETNVSFANIVDEINTEIDKKKTTSTRTKKKKVSDNE